MSLFFGILQLARVLNFAVIGTEKAVTMRKPKEVGDNSDELEIIAKLTPNYDGGDRQRHRCQRIGL